MSDFYRHLLSSVADMQGQPVVIPDEMNPPFLPVTTPIHSSMYQIHPSLGYFQGLYEPVVLNTYRPQKPRRRSAYGPGGGTDQKHRRTRSGCFTCRSRRVKCDEARPVCERCRKGSRDCMYPEPQMSRCRSNQASKTKGRSNHASPTTSNEGDDEDDVEQQEAKLKSIHDEKDLHGIPCRDTAFQAGRRASTASSNVQRSIGRQLSETPSRDSQSTSPSASVLTTRSWTPAPYQTPPEMTHAIEGRLDWSHLPLDFQHHLGFFIDNITNYHYSLIVDEDDFFKTILPNIAIQCEPLLNALVGFSAYHATLQDPNVRLEDFLQYYNKSVTQLLTILTRKDTISVQVLLTILQLATIEEYLGDWVSLMGHQKAAFEIITQIFSPQSIAQSPLGRMCLHWYARFDNIVALLGGFPMEIPREWLVSMVEFYQVQIACCPHELRWRIEERCTRLRLIAYDMSMLYVCRDAEQISPLDYDGEHEQLSMQLEDWRSSCNPSLTDPAYPWTKFSRKQMSDAPHLVGSLPPDWDISHDNALFNNTIITAEWHSLVIVHKSQSWVLPIEELYEELSQHAYAVCQHFALIEHWPSAPAGGLIAMQPCLTTAALFLPHYPNHNMWLRRKFALLESLGHILPKSHRAKLAELFRDSSCIDWWLPEKQGLTPVLQSIRSFADERNAEAVTAQQEDLREMRRFFARQGEERTTKEYGGDGEGEDDVFCKFTGFE